MKVAIICIFSTISILILLTLFLQSLAFYNHIPHKTLLLPRTCLSNQASTVLCYSCLRRNLAPELKWHTVRVNSSQKFNYIVFKKKTNYSCDELLQMIQATNYHQSGVLKIQYLQSVYDALIAFKAKAYRIPANSFNLLPNQYQALIVQRIQKIKVRNSVLRVTTLSNQTDRIMRVTLQFLIILSFSAVILTQLTRLYHNIGVDYSFLIKLIIAVLCFIRVKTHNKTIADMNFGKYEKLLFSITLLWNHPNISYFIPFISLNFFFEQYQWILLSECCMIIAFINSFIQIKYLREDKITLHTITVFILFIISKYVLSTETKAWDTIPYSILYQIILLYSSTVNSILLIFQDLKATKKIQLKKYMSLKVRQDQQDILSNDRR